MNEQISDTQRLLRNLIRIGTVAAVNLDDGTCRVDTGKNTTAWLHWLTARAGKSRSWNAPSVGEQVLVLCLGGELDTGFVLPGIYSDAYPAPSASADALHWSFPDGAVIEYEPDTGALTAAGLKTASVEAEDSISATTKVVIVTASEKITLDAPLVECSALLKTATLEVTQGGTMKGDVTHTGGSLSSNGKVLHSHIHPGDSGGKTGAPV